jgi:SAM-dependent methyltransferase
MKTVFEITLDDLMVLHGRTRAVVDFCEGRAPVGGKSESEFRLLNVGCGFGWLEMQGVMKQLSIDFYSIERSEADLTTINHLVKHESVKPVVASGLNLPFTDGSFDLVVVSEVLEHIPKGTESSLLIEIMRVLRPNGAVLVTTPKRSIRSCLSDPAWIFGHRHYSEKKLHQLARSSGLNVITIESRGGWAELFSLLDLYFSKWVLRRRPVLGAILSKRLDSEWHFSSNRNFMNLWIVLSK